MNKLNWQCSLFFSYFQQIPLKIKPTINRSYLQVNLSELHVFFNDIFMYFFHVKGNIFMSVHIFILLFADPLWWMFRQRQHKMYKTINIPINAFLAMLPLWKQRFQSGWDCPSSSRSKFSLHHQIFADLKICDTVFSANRHFFSLVT